MARPQFLEGREIVDAIRPASINIRQRHIDDAVAGNGEKCVAGKCMLQSLDAAWVWVYRSVTYVVWDDDGPAVRYRNSDALMNNVIKVLDDPKQDNSKIKAGVYDLVAPSPTQRLGVNRKARPGAKKRSVSPTGVRKARFLGRVTSAKVA
jgi:hypothetical protein